MLRFSFAKAFELMKDDGFKVGMPEWDGYWCWDNEKKTIMIHCADGTILDIRETNDVAYTFGFICRDDWEIKG